MDCQHRARLSAFYDGELPGHAAREVRLHVETCPWCAAELEEIRELSGAFRELAEERPPVAVLRRAREAADAAADAAARVAVDARRAGPPVLRVAGALTALAASVLVIASAWLSDAPPPNPLPPAAVSVAPAPAWERVAMTLNAGPLPGEITDDPGRTALADARLANWMLQNLGVPAQGVP